MFSSKLWFTLVLITFLCFAALLTLQILEYLHYGADPTIWPPQV